MKKTTEKVGKSKKAPAKASIKPAGKAAAKIVARKPEVVQAPEPVRMKIKMTAKDKRELKDNLLTIREGLTAQMTALRQDSLSREPSENTVEDGTDAFDRQISLNLVDSEHEEVVAIDDALLRLEEGTYGVCETCNCAIEKPRLKALPFVRMCVKCQSENEKGRTKYRPLSTDTTM